MGEVYLFNGRYIPSFNISTLPNISNNKASEIAKQTSKSEITSSEFELIVFPGLDMENPKLAWSISLLNKLGIREQFIIDANNSKILFKDDGIRY